MKRKLLPFLFTFVCILTCKSENLNQIDSLVGVWMADFNADSSRIITQLRGGDLGLWDSKSGTQIPCELSDSATVVDYALNPTASHVLIQPTPGEFRVHELQSGKATSPTIKVSDPSPKGSFSSDGATVWIRSTNGTVRVFESTSGRTLMNAHLPPDNEGRELDSLPQYCPSRGWALLLDSIGQLHRYDTRTWQEVMPPIVHPLSESGYFLGFSVSSDGLHAVTFDSPGENGPDGTLQIWDLKTLKPIGKPESGTNGISVTFLGDSRCLIRPSRGTARVVGLPSLETEFEIRRHDDVEGSNVRVTSGKNGKYLLSWGYDQSLFLSHLADGNHAGNAVLPCHLSSVLDSDEPEHLWAILDNTVFIGNPYYDFYVVKYSLPEMRPSATLRLQEFIHLASLSHDHSRLLILQGQTDRERVSLFDAQTLVEHSFKTDSQ
jgi:hypothetical protein